MSDRLPYEEQLTQQWNDLPLPDENMAWEDMKRRLEEDDDGGVIPIWLRGCGLWGLLAIVLIGIGWWIVRPEKLRDKKQETESVTTVKQKENSTNDIRTNDTTQLINKPGKEKTTINETTASKDPVPDNSLESSSPNKTRSSVKENNDLTEVKKSQPKTNKTSIKKETSKKNSRNNEPVLDKKKQIEDGQADISKQPVTGNKKDAGNAGEIKNNPVIKDKDSASIANIPVSKTDSVSKKAPVDSVSKNKTDTSAKANQPKKDSTKPKSISFSAGLGMQQLIPIDGQKFTPYNSQGRKGSLADYIPSVFARMYKNEKWFAQLEFRYGAPQYTKDVLYSQQSTLDTIGPNNHIITSSYQLKKTFYHQLSLSFNYFVLKNWSFGGGFTWNKFTSAVSEETIDRKEITTQVDSIISKKIIATSNDTSSVFTKSYFQALIETQYRWRRFSLGARYSFGLQPYIKFNLSGTAPQEEKNSSLQIFLRYELWKSKAKSSKEKKK